MLYIYSVYVYIEGVCGTYFDGECYISGQVLNIWMMNIIYLDDSYIYERWRLQFWTTITYLDDGGYIFGQLLHI